MMKSFLSEVVSYVIQKHQDLSNIVLVLPSKRAGVFLKHELSKQIQATSFAPEIISIEELIENISGYTAAENTELLFQFYIVYKTHTPKAQLESFETFSKWAQIVLQDFNEIDRYLIPQEQLFNYVSNIQELNHWKFEEAQSDLVKNYLAFWNKLSEYYKAFTARIAKQGIAYQGLLYREAVDSIEFYIEKNDHKKHYFIGFNALNTAEEKIIQELLHVGLAEILWDADVTFFEDPNHDASLFLRKHRFTWKYFDNHPFEWIASNFSKPKNINLIGVPKNVTQAKYIGELLETVQETQGNLHQTAVVLGEEQLLIPCLNSLPKGVDKLNITMGFPLKEIPLAITFNHIFLLQEHYKNEAFFYKNVITLLSDTTLRTLFIRDEIDYASKIIQYIQSNNIIYVTIDEILGCCPNEVKTILKTIFSYWENNPKIGVTYCLRLIQKLKDIYITDREQHMLTLEYIYRFYEVFNQINFLLQQYAFINDVKSLFTLYKEVVSTETLDFKGEPLEGLQLMGMLETRVLDFKTVIISSVNEGVLPSGKSNSSFIPFDVKKQFGLPTYKEKDAIYTYHFYRLLQRAENAYILYNTEAEGLHAGEKSRFIMQLETYPMPNHTITNQVVIPQVPKIATQLQSISKTPEMITRLQEIAAKGFSPSALTSYIRNPIDFYYQKILGIQEYNEVEETVAANTLGTIVHDTLELLYKPFEGKTLAVADVKKMFLNVEQLITENFKKTYGKGNIKKGKNLIIFNVAKRYVTNFLQQEIKILETGKTLKILKIEQNLTTQIDIPELGFPVLIGGKVDRVDELDGILRIIDYKTGKVTQPEVEIADWEVLTEDYKYSKSFQVLAYAYMLYSQENIQQQIEGGIISFKNLKNGFLKFATKQKGSRTKNTLITAETFDDFLIQLKSLIVEICNPEIAFNEKEL